MKIILINGQGGTGKSTVAYALKDSLLNSVYIEADSLVSVQPFNFGNPDLDSLMFKNALSLIHNFSEAGYEYIVTSGLTRNQKLLDEFVFSLDINAEIIFVWLRADKKVRLSRKISRNRDGADKLDFFEIVDKVYPDVEKIDLKTCKYISIDTTSKTIQEVVSEVRAGI